MVMEKKFVEIIAAHGLDGTTKPLAIKWGDGRVFAVDRVLDVRRAAALKAGGQGMRYTCRVCGRQVYLFCDEGRWFIGE